MRCVGSSKENVSKGNENLLKGIYGTESRVEISTSLLVTVEMRWRGRGGNLQRQPHCRN